MILKKKWRNRIYLLRGFNSEGTARLSLYRFVNNLVAPVSRASTLGTQVRLSDYSVEAVYTAPSKLKLVVLQRPWALLPAPFLELLYNRSNDSKDINSKWVKLLVFANFQ
jgi:hypothetical protein